MVGPTTRVGSIANPVSNCDERKGITKRSGGAEHHKIGPVAPTVDGVQMR
jgi:hypothetical protein